MADDSLYVQESLDFHSCDTPRGTTYYDLDVLTPAQKRELFYFKGNAVRENAKYLAAHPEIRAIVSMIYKKILNERPRTDVHKHVAMIFTKPKKDLQEEIDKYLGARKDHKYEGDSAVDLRVNEIRLERVQSFISKDILPLLMKKVKTHVFIKHEVLGALVDRVCSKLTRPLSDEDTTAYGNIIATTLSETIFDIYSKMPTESNENLLNAAMKKLINDEILKHIDSLSDKISETINVIREEPVEQSEETTSQMDGEAAQDQDYVDSYIDDFITLSQVMQSQTFSDFALTSGRTSRRITTSVEADKPLVIKSDLIISRREQILQETNTDNVTEELQEAGIAGVKKEEEDNKTTRKSRISLAKLAQLTKSISRVDKPGEQTRARSVTIANDQKFAEKTDSLIGSNNNSETNSPKRSITPSVGSTGSKINSTQVNLVSEGKKKIFSRTNVQ